ncbi:MAG TPA: hypothetical protein VD996_04330, partial [Chitinophagaceae bacterium]|nr:hypothetical protein [Chitinophagaceae bacterium]
MRPKTNTTLSFKVFMLLAALQLALSNSSFSQSEVNTDVTYGFSTNRAMLWVPAGWNSVASHERWGIVNCPGAGTVATEGGIGIVDNEGLHYYLTNNTFDLQGVVITPQRPSTGGSTEVNQPMIGAAIDYLITNYGVTRIYLTGYSLGASDVYDYARLNAHKISGVYFVAGSTAHTPLPGTNDSLALLPMWFHTGTADGMQPMG